MFREVRDFVPVSGLACRWNLSAPKLEQRGSWNLAVILVVSTLTLSLLYDPRSFSALCLTFLGPPFGTFLGCI